MQDRNTFKQAISEFSLAINEAVVNLTFKLSQGGKQPTISTVHQQEHRANVQLRQKNRAARQQQKTKMLSSKIKVTHPPGGSRVR